GCRGCRPWLLASRCPTFGRICRWFPCRWFDSGDSLRDVARMSHWLSILRTLANFLSASTRYTACGVSFFALGAIVSVLCGSSWHLGFLIGFCLPWGPLYAYYTRRGALQAYLDEIEGLRTTQRIKREDYERCKLIALRWHSERLFGSNPG